MKEHVFYDEMEELAEEISLSKEVVKIQLSKCSNTSSPGVSGISYKLLKEIFNLDPVGFTKIIEDIINNKCNTEVFSELIVKPI